MRRDDASPPPARSRAHMMAASAHGWRWPSVAALVLLGVACAGGTEAVTFEQRGTTVPVHTSVGATPTWLTAPPSTVITTTVLTAPPSTAVTTTSVATTSTVASSTTVAGTTTTQAPASTTSPPIPPPPSPPVTPGAAAWTVPQPSIGPHTSCRQVAHIGDSTSEHLWDASTVGGDPGATMEARYHAVGVDDVYNDTSGGRSMVERINRQQRNGLEVAEEVRARGFRGCWVLMIGTNDAANVAAGANLGLDARIESMLAIIGGDPVLWVNTASSSSIQWYGDDSMQAFNAALADAATRHPNLWVLDWAALVRPDWYGPDGLHHNATGRAWRTALTVQELAFAFPG